MESRTQGPPLWWLWGARVLLPESHCCQGDRSGTEPSQGGGEPRKWRDSPQDTQAAPAWKSPGSSRLQALHDTETNRDNEGEIHLLCRSCLSSTCSNICLIFIQYPIKLLINLGLLRKENTALERPDDIGVHGAWLLVGSHSPLDARGPPTPRALPGALHACLTELQVSTCLRHNPVL